MSGRLTVDQLSCESRAEGGLTTQTLSPSLRWYRVLLFLLLLLLPTVVFWPTISHRYGFRDDYSILREAREEPGKIFWFLTSHGRPVGGVLLEKSASWVGQIDNLKWMRGVGALCVGLVSGSLFLILTSLGWEAGLGFLLAANLAFLPAAQLIASWAATWTNAPAAMMGLAGFYVAERSLKLQDMRPRLTGVLTSGALVGLGTMIYQPNSLFYLVAVAAGLVSFSKEGVWPRVLWLIKLLFTLFIGLTLAFVLSSLVFELGLVEPDERMAIEADLPDKLVWFVQSPLLNALGLMVLNDDLGGAPVLYGVAVAMTSLMIALGVWREWQQRGLSAGLFWAGGFVLLALASYGVSIVASERWSTYRTLWPLTGIVLVFSTAALRSFTGGQRRPNRVIVPVVLTLLLFISVTLARRQTYELIALPQSQELALVEEAAQEIRPLMKPRIFIVRPSREDTLAPSRWADEFGSLTTDSDWAPKEMLKLIVKGRFPEIRDTASLCTYETGSNLPMPHAYDLIIDLRQALKFKGHGHRQADATTDFLLSRNSLSESPGE